MNDPKLEALDRFLDQLKATRQQLAKLRARAEKTGRTRLIGDVAAMERQERLAHRNASYGYLLLRRAILARTAPDEA